MGTTSVSTNCCRWESFLKTSPKSSLFLNDNAIPRKCRKGQIILCLKYVCSGCAQALLKKCLPLNRCFKGCCINVTACYGLNYTLISSLCIAHSFCMGFIHVVSAEVSAAKEVHDLAHIIKKGIISTLLFYHIKMNSSVHCA